MDFKAVKDLVVNALKGPNEVLGVDIGSSAIKVVWIKGGKLGGWAHLPVETEIELPPEERVNKAIEVLKSWSPSSKSDLKQAATAVSGNAVIVRYVRLPLLSKGELMKTLPIEAEPFIPFDIKEVNLGAHILGEVMDEGQKKMETVLVAAKKEVIQNRVDVLTATGIAPVIIDVDAFAIEGVHEVSKFKGEQGGVLYLNIGNTVTNLSIIEAGVTRVVRDIFISGGSFTKAMQKALGCDWSTAQKKKAEAAILVTPEEKEQALGSGNQEALPVSQALVSVMKDLVTEMQRSVDFYLSQGAERSINRVVLAGGGAMLRNFPQALAQELKVPVDVLNPLEFLSDPAVANIPPDKLSSLAVATGLALRKMKDWQ
jgi:type IV pilus assembly protein PilM